MVAEWVACLVALLVAMRAAYSADSWVDAMAAPLDGLWAESWVARWEPLLAANWAA